jgi:predicted nuclease with TOPRIM domain
MKQACHRIEEEQDRIHKEDVDLFHDYDELTNQHTNQIKGVRDRVQTMDTEGANLFNAYNNLADQYNDMYNDRHRLRDEGQTLDVGTGEPNKSRMMNKSRVMNKSDTVKTKTPNGVNTPGVAWSVCAHTCCVSYVGIPPMWQHGHRRF